MYERSTIAKHWRLDYDVSVICCCTARYESESHAFCLHRRAKRTASIAYAVICSFLFEKPTNQLTFVYTFSASGQTHFLVCVYFATIACCDQDEVGHDSHTITFRFSANGTQSHVNDNNIYASIKQHIIIYYNI